LEQLAVLQASEQLALQQLALQQPAPEQLASERPVLRQLASARLEQLVLAVAAPTQRLLGRAPAPRAAKRYCDHDKRACSLERVIGD
jgi:hypothetical protein